MKLSSRRILRRLGVVLAASLAGIALMAAPSGADEPGTELGPRAEFGEPNAKPPAYGTNVPGAPVRCDVSYGNDITISDGTLNVTWATACRWTDDGQLSTEVANITTQIFFFKNGQFIPPDQISPCVDPRASTTCSHRVPFDGTAGSYDTLAFITVNWNDGYPPIQGVFASPGFVLI